MVQRQFCPFHASEDVPGKLLPDGTYSFTCERTQGHPTSGQYNWLHDPVSEQVGGLTGLAEELGLATELPAALASLGEGWFEYGLVERTYARAKPQDFALIVERWGHTALQHKQYTCSAYIAGTLGRLAKDHHVHYRPGKGTGRWDFNQPISYWSLDPAADWEKRTTWVDVVGDAAKADKEADLACKAYVQPSTPGQ